MIPLAEPNLTGKELEYVAQAIASGWVGPDGPFVERFEDMVAKASGRAWAVATITGTAALHASASVLGFAGAVIDVPLSVFPAARHVFDGMGCEIRDVTGGTEHDTQGYIANGRRWPVLCDRAPAIGEPPTSATLECYSFAANKTVTCGQGGAVVGDDQLLRFELQTTIRQGYYLLGRVNYRMANLNAALGCVQMERLAEFRMIKSRIWDCYCDASLPMVDRGESRWMSTLECDEHEHFAHYLKEAGIEARIEPSGISIPCSTTLTEEDQDKVIKACAAFSP